jgi:hypothetical protein
VTSRGFLIEDRRVSRSSPDRLLRLILDPSTWPSWQPEILSMDGGGRVVEGRPVEGTAKLLGFVVEGKSTPVGTGDSYFEEDVIVGVRLRVRYEVQPSDRGSIVVRRLSAQLPRGLSGTILSFFLKRRLKRMQSSVLDELVRQSEAS